jgi:hypothetical protein
MLHEFNLRSKKWYNTIEDNYEKNFGQLQKILWCVLVNRETVGLESLEKNSLIIG